MYHYDAVVACFFVIISRSKRAGSAALNQYYPALPALADVGALLIFILKGSYKAIKASIFRILQEALFRNLRRIGGY